MSSAAKRARFGLGIFLLVVGVVILAFGYDIASHPETKYRIRGIGTGIACMLLGALAILTSRLGKHEHDADL